MSHFMLFLIVCNCSVYSVLLFCLKKTSLHLTSYQQILSTTFETNCPFHYKRGIVIYLSKWPTQRCQHSEVWGSNQKPNDITFWILFLVTSIFKIDWANFGKELEESQYKFRHNRLSKCIQEKMEYKFHWENKLIWFKWRFLCITESLILFQTWKAKVCG